MCQHEQLLDIQAAIFKQLFMLTHTERLLWRRLSDGADFALQTRVECRAAEAELVLVTLRSSKTVNEWYCAWFLLLEAFILTYCTKFQITERVT